MMEHSTPMMLNALRAGPTRKARLIMGALICLAVERGGGLGAGRDSATAHPLSPCLQAAKIIQLADYLMSITGPPDSYSLVRSVLFSTAGGASDEVTAFEENASFIYAVGNTPATQLKLPNEPPGAAPTRRARRVIILNSSIFVIDDEFHAAHESRTCCLLSTIEPQISGRRALVRDAADRLSLQTLFPDDLVYHIHDSGAATESAPYRLESASRGSNRETRRIQLLRVEHGVTVGAKLESSLIGGTGSWKLTVMTEDRIFRLALPPPTEGGGEIAIATPGGKELVANRPLPSGTLPHGPEGSRRLDRWDSDYRGETPAPWDIGRPANELQKVVEEGHVHPCRALDLCCGTGSDAIYLASKGFDVTAVDIAPTALRLAMQKAAKAGVSVRWILADVLALPNLGSFDFIYDRGCYHVVRDQNVSNYLKTIQSATLPGSQFFLLAARRDEQAPRETSGVTEDELRFDFLPRFDVVWLRQVRLESNRPGLGPPGWSAMLRRTATP
jgi:SAM-dependent methyltransferase